MYTKKLIALLVVAVMAVSVFAACGGSTTPPAGTEAPAQNSTTNNAAATTPAPAAAEGGGGGILRFGNTSIESKFIPTMSSNVYDSDVCSILFEQLIEVSPSGEFVSGNITESWELSPDNLTYTFKIKEGVKFSNGAPMTAEDIAFTYKTAGHPDYDGPRTYVVDKMEGYAEYNAGGAEFSGIKVIDDRTISFTFADGEASPANIECFVYGIMSKDHYEFDTWEDFLRLLAVPMGSGLFVLDDYVHQEFWMFSRNDNYWDPANAAKLDGILINNVPIESLMGAIQTNQIDFFQQSPVNHDARQMIDDTPGIHSHVFVGNGYTFMQFNTTLPKLSDARVRQALMYALDRKEFISVEFGEGLGWVGASPFSPLSWATPAESELNYYEFDLAKAEGLMNEAGWFKNSSGMLEKDGEVFSVSWLVYPEATWPGTLSGMAADSWKQLGVDLNIIQIDFNTVAARTMDAPIEEKDFDIYTMGFSLSLDPDPTGALFDADAYGTGGFNATGYRNDRAQELIRIGRSSFDQNERKATYMEFAKLMNEELPTVIVNNRAEIWAIRDTIKGFENMGPYSRWSEIIRDVYIAD